jgi:hypothetical protein
MRYTSRFFEEYEKFGLTFWGLTGTEIFLNYKKKDQKSLIFCILLAQNEPVDGRVPGSSILGRHTKFLPNICIFRLWKIIFCF